MLMLMREALTSCRHQPRTIGRVAVVACVDCGAVEWWNQAGRPIDAAEGMAAVFGQFDLIGRYAAIGTPAPSVLVYAAPGRRHRAGLDLLVEGCWLEVHPDLWATKDADGHLLLAPTDPVLAANLA